MLCESLKSVSAKGTLPGKPLLEMSIAFHIVSMLPLLACGISKLSLQHVLHCSIGMYAGREWFQWLLAVVHTMSARHIAHCSCEILRGVKQASVKSLEQILVPPAAR